MSRPLVSASRYELIASGPAFVSVLTVDERSFAGKYRIDRKLVVVPPPSANEASLASSPSCATAIALLVVPKSNPMTGGISLFQCSQPQPSTALSFVPLSSNTSDELPS